MKKIQRKDAIRNIFRKKVSWLSIMIVTLLTVGVFLGCRFFIKSMQDDGKNYYRDHNYKDFEVISYTGILPSELEICKKVEGVVDVEGYDQLDVTADLNGANLLIPLIRKTEHVSTPELLEGKLPENKGEIAISSSLILKYKLKIGDKISLYSEGTQDKLLATHDFVITGFVNHPEFLQASQSDFLLTSDASFDREEIGGGYLRAAMTVDYPDSLDVFSQSYYDTVQEVEDRVQALFPDLIVSHREELRAIAEQKIQDETAGPREQLREAEEKLEDARSQLKEGEDKLINAKKELDEGEQKLIDAEKKLEDGKKKLDDGKKELEDGEKKYAEGKAKYDEKSASVNKELDSAKAKLDSAEKEADAGLAKLDKAENILKLLKVGPELSGAYYSAKEQAVENYRAAMEAAVNQQDNTQLLQEAESATNRLIDQSIGQIEVDDLLGKTDYQTIMQFAALVSPDKKALDFLKSNVVFSADEPEVQHMITYLTENEPDISLKDFADKVSSIEELKEDATKEVVGIKATIDRLIKTYFNGYGKALAAKEAIAGAREKWAAGRATADEELAKAKQELDAARKKLDDGKATLEEKEKQYEDGLKEYEEGREKLENGKAEYEDGLKKYEEKKATFDSGEQEFLKNKQELDDKVAEAREKIDEKLEGLFAIQNRRANYGFVNIFSNIKTISLASGAFIILFLLVCAMVTFSTIAILVDEQRVLAGSMKSLGFFNGAIRAKYLLYGISAAVIGSILGFPTGFLVEMIFRRGVGKMYVYGLPSITYTVWPFIISSVLVIAVVIAAVYISTHGMLKLTAIQLMAGFKKEKSVKKTSRKKKSSGIYGRLIGRNMKTEMARVVITTMIVAISCSLIGVGFCMRNSFAGIVDQEVNRVWGYDIKVTYGNNVDDKTMERLERALNSFGVSYGKAAEIGSIYRDKDLQEYTYILVMDQDLVSDFYHVRDWDTGEEMQLPEDGVLIMNRLMETRDLKVGDNFTLFDEKLREHDVTVKGVFENYVGRTVIMSRYGYYKLFGLRAKNNIFFVRLNGVDKRRVISTLKRIVPGITVSAEENINGQFSELQTAFDAVVILLTVVAILMSIFILANLTNIFVSRRRKELIVMRVNGFSVKQCIMYLIREALITSILGFIIAIILGTLLSAMMIAIIEQPDVMMFRGFQPVSWVIAVLMEAVFAFVTDFLAFRKVKNVKVTDINA